MYWGSILLMRNCVVIFCVSVTLLVRHCVGKALCWSNNVLTWHYVDVTVMLECHYVGEILCRKKKNYCDIFLAWHFDDVAMCWLDIVLVWHCVVALRLLVWHCVDVGLCEYYIKWMWLSLGVALHWCDGVGVWCRVGVVEFVRALNGSHSMDVMLYIYKTFFLIWIAMWMLNYNAVSIWLGNMWVLL